MKKTIEEILEIINRESTLIDFINLHKRTAIDFTRNRSLSFKDIIYFVIGILGTSMDFEVLNYFESEVDGVTTSAISQARDKVKYTAFSDLLCLTSKEIPVLHTFAGYRVMSFDGLKG